MAAKTVVGLEITEESVRAAEVTVGPTPTLVAYGEVALPEGAAKDSEVLDRDAVSVALQQLWAQAGISSRKVVLGVGSRRILVREYATPLMSIEHIKQALPFQVQDLLPVPVNQAVLDFYPISEEEGIVQGLLVAAVAETIEELVETLTKANLRVDRIDLAPFGLARASRSVAPAEQAAVMLHIGEHTSHVVVAVDGVPRFVRIVPAEVATAATLRRAGTEVFIDDTADLAVANARGGRASLRLQAAQEQAAATLTHEAAASVSDLANRVRNTVEFYRSRPGALPISGVYVSGAGAGNAAVIPALQSALDHPVTPVALSQVLESFGEVTGDLALNLVGTVGFVLGEEK